MNSGHEQCPNSDSKLGQVHSVHAHGPGCSHATRWADRIVASSPSCRRLCPVVSWSCPTVSQRRVVRYAARCVAHRAQCRSAVSHPSRSHRGARPAVSQHCITTRSAARPRARSSGLITGPLGRIAAQLVVSWPSRGHIVVGHARLLCCLSACLALLCHDTICCIVTQHKLKMGSSPFQSLLLFFFFFFFSFDLLEDHQIYFFHF